MPLKKDLWLKYHFNFPIKGGNGTSTEDAIEILMENNLGILLEKDIIACLYCDSEYDFDLLEQRLFQKEGSSFDILKIKLKNNEIKEIYFNVNNFFGKSFEIFSRTGKEYAELQRSMLIRPPAEEEKEWFN